MPVFPVQILNNATPALTIEVADSGVPPVTYQQVKQSLGAQVYKILELYLYSLNINQLLGVIQYQRFDSDGNQRFSSIATTIDPYDGNSVATAIDLRNYEEDFILNGNSSFQSTILPNTYLQVKFWAERITNEFSRNLNNFAQIEIDANKPNFFNNYGASLPEIRETNLEIEKTATLTDGSTLIQLPPHEQSIAAAGEIKLPVDEDDCRHLILLGFAAVAMGAYMIQKAE